MTDTDVTVLVNRAWDAALSLSGGAYDSGYADAHPEDSDAHCARLQSERFDRLSVLRDAIDALASASRRSAPL